jgi:hypothetical protein
MNGRPPWLSITTAMSAAPESATPDQLAVASGNVANRAIILIQANDPIVRLTAVIPTGTRVNSRAVHSRCFLRLGVMLHGLCRAIHLALVLTSIKAD